MDGPDELWRNLGDGTFRLVTAEANLAATAYHHSSGVAFVDIDNDGDEDIYVATSAESRFYLYVNDGLGHFTEDAEARGLGLKPTIPPFQTSTMTIAVGDYDKDGWLDLYTTEWLPHLDQSFDYNNATHSLSRLLRNLGAQGKPGHFEDVTTAAGLANTIEPTVDADRFGGVDVRYYGVMSTGFLKDIIPGPFKLSAMFTDLDNDGESRECLPFSRTPLTGFPTQHTFKTLHSATLHYTTIHYNILKYTKHYTQHNYIIPYRTILYHSIQHYAAPYHTIPSHAMPYHTTKHSLHRESQGNPFKYRIKVEDCSRV